MTLITLGKRNRRTNLQLAQEAMRLSEYDDKRLTDYLEDEMASEVGLVARFSFAEDILDEVSVTVDISSADGVLYADLSTDGEFYADEDSGIVNGDSWADM